MIDLLVVRMKVATKYPRVVLQIIYYSRNFRGLSLSQRHFQNECSVESFPVLDVLDEPEDTLAKMRSTYFAPLHF